MSSVVAPWPRLLPTVEAGFVESVRGIVARRADASAASGSFEPRSPAWVDSSYPPPDPVVLEFLAQASVPLVAEREDRLLVALSGEVRHPEQVEDLATFALADGLPEPLRRMSILALGAVGHVAPAIARRALTELLRQSDIPVIESALQAVAMGHEAAMRGALDHVAGREDLPLWLRETAGELRG